MANDVMNSLIAKSARRTSGLGLIDRLRGATPLGDDRQERLNVQMAAYEAACRHGDHIAAQIADEKIEELLTEARAVRQEAGQPQEPRTSFDGGVRRAATRRPPANMNSLVIRAAAERRALAAAARESV